MSCDESVQRRTVTLEAAAGEAETFDFGSSVLLADPLLTLAAGDAADADPFQVDVEVSADGVTWAGLAPVRDSDGSGIPWTGDAVTVPRAAKAVRVQGLALSPEYATGPAVRAVLSILERS